MCTYICMCVCILVFRCVCICVYIHRFPSSLSLYQNDQKAKTRVATSKPSTHTLVPTKRTKASRRNS